MCYFHTNSKYPGYIYYFHYYHDIRLDRFIIFNLSQLVVVPTYLVIFVISVYFYTVLPLTHLNRYVILVLLSIMSNKSLIESKILFFCSGIMILKYKNSCSQSAIKAGVNMNRLKL